MRFTPTDHKILIKHDAKRETTEGGIVLPSSSRNEKCCFATVIATGPGIRNDATGERIPVDFQEGDRVMINSFLGEDIKIDGEEYKLVREPDILGIVTEA